MKKYPFDLYTLYEDAVQAPEFDLNFILREYKSFYPKAAKPTRFREDFCGTGALVCDWVKRDSKNEAWGLDLDPKPLESGHKRLLPKLSEDQQDRAHLLKRNVLNSKGLPKAQIVCALNYSYFIFKTRSEMLQYFKSVRASIDPSKGLFVLDLFGGLESMIESEESRIVNKRYRYHWECERFNPLTHDSFFAIHFSDRKTGRKFKRAFTYDWRVWTTPELVDLLLEAGFKRVQTYWEGDDGKGGGDGKFYKTQKVTNCASWISYLCALP